LELGQLQAVTTRGTMHQYRHGSPSGSPEILDFGRLEKVYQVRGRMQRCYHARICERSSEGRRK
jgi:hypothetical protein